MATGSQALFSNTTGVENTANGWYTLPNNTVGDGNVALGYQAWLCRHGRQVTSPVSVHSKQAANISHTTWISNVFGTSVGGINAPVIVSEGGQLGTDVSSERFKKDIATMEKTSEAILSLRPVTFHYKSDVKDFPQFGLIAEEVAKVNPALVLLEKEGKPFTVRYNAVNAMLLNEFLKEHRKNEEQQATITELKSTVAQQQKDFQATVAQLTARLDEQASQIHKVSAQLVAASPSGSGLEASKFAAGRIRAGGPAPKVALNNP